MICRQTMLENHKIWFYIFIFTILTNAHCNYAKETETCLVLFDSMPLCRNGKYPLCGYFLSVLARSYVGVVLKIIRHSLVLSTLHSTALKLFLSTDSCILRASLGSSQGQGSFFFLFFLAPSCQSQPKALNPNPLVHSSKGLKPQSPKRQVTQAPAP